MALPFYRSAVQSFELESCEQMRRLPTELCSMTQLERLVFR
jgi:hypothetical protein